MKSPPWSARIDNAALLPIGITPWGGRSQHNECGFMMNQTNGGNPRKTSKPVVSLSALDSIYQRRAVRNYLPSTIDRADIHTLLDAAVHASAAMHGEAWSFAVIQDRGLLNRLSDSTKERVRSEAQGSDSPHGKHSLDLVNKPDFPSEALWHGLIHQSRYGWNT